MIKLVRMATGQHSTLGRLYIDEVFRCYTLEDLPRKVKIPGQTCIPEGEYTLALNRTAGMNRKYQDRYPDMHQGMVEICGIPNFSMVFIHLGNYHTDTAGCPLVGSSYQLMGDDYRVLRSAEAYKRVYPLLAAAAQAGEKLLVTFADTTFSTSAFKSKHGTNKSDGKLKFRKDE